MEKKNGVVLENDGKNIVFRKMEVLLWSMPDFMTCVWKKHQTKWGIPLWQFSDLTMEAMGYEVYYLPIVQNSDFP